MIMKVYVRRKLLISQRKQIIFIPPPRLTTEADVLTKLIVLGRETRLSSRKMFFIQISIEFYFQAFGFC